MGANVRFRPIPAISELAKLTSAKRLFRVVYIRGVRVAKQPLREARGLVVVSALQKARTFLGATTKPNSSVHQITGQLCALDHPSNWREL